MKLNATLDSATAFCCIYEMLYTGLAAVSLGNDRRITMRLPSTVIEVATVVGIGAVGCTIFKY